MKLHVQKISNFFKSLGPGVISGAADDDPSGIATYSLAGTQFGYQLLWTAPFTIPLMIAIQETSARIGIVTKMGFGEIFKKHLPKPLVLAIGLVLFLTNTFNIGADLAGISAAVNLISPLDNRFVEITIAVIIVVLTIYLPYRKIKQAFKIITFVLFAYLFSFLIVEHSWNDLLKGLIPLSSGMPTKTYLLSVLAIFGTTISPYLMVWQEKQEIEENFKSQVKNQIKHEKVDTIVGMFFSNLVMFAIIATCAATLSVTKTPINTAADAALALKPFAGGFASWLFAFGIIGTGILTIPILAASASYLASELFNFKDGLNQRFAKAKGFYLIIMMSILIGVLLNFVGLSPISYLFYAAILNGVVTPILLLLLLYVGNNREIMGEFVNGKWTNFFIFLTFFIMSLTIISMFIV